MRSAAEALRRSTVWLEKERAARGAVVLSDAFATSAAAAGRAGVGGRWLDHAVARALIGFDAGAAVRTQLGGPGAVRVQPRIKEAPYCAVSRLGSGGIELAGSRGSISSRIAS